jgi:endonuclease YncB( thermonuclease family)
MGLFLIKGTFHVVGYSPDGDSIRFRANNFSNWDLLGPGPREINAKQHMQVRLQGIDCMETHYSQGGAESHQPNALSRQARDTLLSELNITQVVWNASQTTVVSANDGVPGYIMARKKDKNGRPIVFVFAGATPDVDGTNVFLNVNRLKTCANYRLLDAGHAYPFYFTNSGLFADLRDALTKAASDARGGKLGVYAADKTNVGVDITSTTVITNQEPLFPRLFRRLAEFLEGNPPVLIDFRAFLAARNDRVIVQSPMNETGFDNLVEVNGQTVRLIHLPENLVFIE